MRAPNSAADTTTAIQGRRARDHAPTSTPRNSNSSPNGTSPATTSTVPTSAPSPFPRPKLVDRHDIVVQRRQQRGDDRADEQPADRRGEPDRNHREDARRRQLLAGGGREEIALPRPVREQQPVDEQERGTGEDHGLHRELGARVARR